MRKDTCIQDRSEIRDKSIILSNAKLKNIYSVSQTKKDIEKPAYIENTRILDGLTTECSNLLEKKYTHLFLVSLKNGNSSKYCVSN